MALNERCRYTGIRLERYNNKSAARDNRSGDEVQRRDVTSFYDSDEANIGEMSAYAGA